MESEDDTNCNWSTKNGPKRLGRKTGGIGNQKKNRDRPDNSIIEIGVNTEKNPGIQRRYTASQTLVKDPQLMLVWKTR